MEHEFNELPWHDAELLSIVVDRRSPGEKDQVAMEVCWPDGKESTLVFDDCYGLEIEMNFGVLAPESILDASLTETSAQLDELKKKWAHIDIQLDKLKCFEIKTNSTASVMRIYALEFYLS